MLPIDQLNKLVKTVQKHPVSAACVAGYLLLMTVMAEKSLLLSDLVEALKAFA